MNAADLAVDVGLMTLVGGALALDRRGAFQLMVSQPLVVIPLLGLLFGDLDITLRLGALVQLLWMSSLIVGASVPPNETLAAVVIGGGVVLYGRHVGPPDPAVQTLAVMVGAPVAILGRWLAVRLDRQNLTLCARADQAAREGAPAMLARLPLYGLLRTFVAEGLLLAVSLFVAVGVLVFLRSRLGTATTKSLEVLYYYVFPAIGLAVALSTVRRRRAVLLAAIAFVMATLGMRAVWVP